VIGGTMDRPALQRLLQAVQSGQIDTIVVHRIDRLSRSLADFAKLVEIFDTYKVTFVSVTQSFNTTTSMGRLTLNILLSFAQFEREVVGERVRDKIAASRQRGMWMGGMPPYDYDVVNRKLVPNPQEAAIVREMFPRFAALPSMAKLLRDLRARGVTSKSWTTRNGKHRTGKLIDKGYIYRLFESPLYIGIAAYKGNHYPGEHEPLIDRSLWDQVQRLIQTGSPRAKRHYAPRTTTAPSILRGLLVSTEGRAFTRLCNRVQPKIRLALTPYLRATSATERPGCCASSTIATFSAFVRMQRTPPGLTLDTVAVSAEVSICVSSGHFIPRRSSEGHLPQAFTSMTDGGDRTVTSETAFREFWAGPQSRALSRSAAI
jgi:DNA invertase Pin-like site-specific DNA recombinase